MAFLVFCGAGMLRLHVDYNTRVFFGKENPYYQSLRNLEQTFGNEQHVVLVVHPRAKKVFRPDVLAAVASLTESCWQIPYCRKVHSLTNHPYIRAEEDELIVRPLVEDPNSLTEADCQRIANYALADKGLVNLIISPSGHCTGIYVSCQLPGGSGDEIREVADFCYQILRQAQKAYPDIEFYLTGSLIVDEAFGDAASRDLYTLAPVMLLVLTGLVGLALRSFWATIITIVVIASSMLTGLGLAGWIGIPINAASAGAAVLILTLSVADTVHLLATMVTAMRLGTPKTVAISQAIRENLRSVFLTNITTIFGFSGVNFSESPPFRDLANIVNIGVGSAFVYAVLLLPAIAAICPIRVRPGPEPAPLRLTRYLTGLSITYYKPVLVGVAFGVIGSLVGLARIEFDDNYLTYLDRSYEFRRASDFMVQNLTGWDLIEYALPARTSNGITDPCYLELVDRFAQWHRQQPCVRYVGSFADVVKRVNQLMHGDDPNYYSIPLEQDLIAQYLLLYEISLPPGHDLNDRIDVDRSMTRMTVLLQSVPSSTVRLMEQAGRRWLQENAPAWMHSPATGLSLVWAHITERNVRSMFWGSLLSLILVSCCLFVGLRSWRLALVSLLPNLVPPLMALGIWGMVFCQVGLGLSVVIAMTIGIVVDDTIHFLSKYQEARGRGLEIRASIREAFYTVGMAMWVMTVALVVGFLVLTLSHYRISVEMGLICAMTFGIACWMDYLILPGALILLDRKVQSIDRVINPGD
ncbi:MAG: MMPL family transporter [Sedimentisphaerales bacterium]|nr:MMPL family transporter [Sedimentisphaerales bacterium]